MKMTFDMTEDGMALMAAYVSGLVKAGVGFRIRQDTAFAEVELTGNF